MILLVTTSSRAKECAAAVEQGTGHKTHVASSVPQAVSKLEAADYEGLAIDQSVLESDFRALDTLLNHCGIRADLLPYTVDRSPHKQGMFLPGTHIPVYSPERIEQTKPDYVLVLPWNLRDEIGRQLSFVRSWGGRLVFPIPELEIV